VVLFPTPPAYIIEYITFAVNRGLAPGTITSQLSAVSYCHKLVGVPDPNQHFVVQKMLAGARKLKPQCDARLPITPDVLHLLIRAVDVTSEAPYYNVLIKSMFLLAFHAFLRVGEFTFVNSDQRHTLQYADVHLQTQQSTRSLVVKMSSFKHSGQTPTYLQIASQPGPLCPVAAYLRYSQMRGASKGPLYIFPDKTPVSRAFFTEQLNMALRWARLDPKHYKGHSFRLGAATTAAANGMSEARIEAMGRWHSKAYKKYIRIQIATVV
jgi:hypothetical protein